MALGMAAYIMARGASVWTNANLIAAMLFRALLD
jgi:hypothetical protein